MSSPARFYINMLASIRNVPTKTKKITVKAYINSTVLYLIEVS